MNDPGLPCCCSKLFRWLWSAAVSLVFCFSAGAPQAVAADVQSGLHYYALENLQTHRVEQRGEAGSLGVAFDNLILAPSTPYRAWILQAATFRVGYLDFTSAPNGGTLRLPPIMLGTPLSADSDGDGLSDEGEFIMGTDAKNPDSDGDGVNDGAEVRQGTNPLDGKPTRTGIIATAKTPGPAVDVFTLNDVVVIACAEAGVSVFNVFNGMNPTIIAQVDTPGTALAVALAGQLIAVADGPAGVAIIDISKPETARITHQIGTDGLAQAVDAAAGVAYVGLTSGKVLVVDLMSGTVVDQLTLPLPIQDLQLAGDNLFVLTEGTLYSVSLDGQLAVIGSVATPGGVNTANGRMRLFVGGGIAYPVHRNGYNTISVTNPAQPRVIFSGNTPQFGWKQIVLNGSGLGVAAVSPNQAFDGPHNVSLYDVRNPASNNVFITEFVTPGIARAVSIFNGIAYAADHTAGLQVINYLPYDSLKVPPVITLSANFSLNPPRAEEGKIVRVTADVRDDVQVRNVEFYIDDQKVATDGNFPFEHRFAAPLLANQSSFKLRARASDTGGNATWTDEIVITLARDATPPRVMGVSPRDGSRVGRIPVVSAFFSEALDPASLNANSFTLTEAGLDGRFDTADDVRVAGGVIQFSPEGFRGSMIFNSGLPFGAYRAALSTGITDLAGNHLSTPFTFQFEVRAITIVAERGTPADPFQSSANVRQMITIQSPGLTNGAQVVFPTRDSSGAAGQRSVAITGITADRAFGNVVVPDDAETGLIKLPNGTDLFLQIVPTLTKIQGGKGQFTAIFGSGFIEGKITVRFGAVAVADRGPSFNDGIDVRFGDFENGRLDVTVPLEGSLPYEVITAGGSSGRVTDVLDIPSVATSGTSAVNNEASANVGQKVTLLGEGFKTNLTKLTLEAVRSDNGLPYITTLDPDSIASDGRSLVFTVPPEARTGIASVLSGGTGQLLQIVPMILSIDGGRGRPIAIFGRGFTEGFTTVRFGAVSVTDRGPSFDDGIDVRFWDVENGRLDVTAPTNASLPYVVITEGGSSGQLADVASIPNVAASGTPALSTEASANVGQRVTLLGSGFVTNTTKVTLEAVRSDNGVPYITSITPDSIAADGRSLIFTVPPEARTGIAAVLNGASGKLLQIVPVILAIDGGRGRFTAIFGRGFTEGFTTVRFGMVSVTDRGPSFDDGIDVRFWDVENGRLDVTPPTNASLPYVVITEGGSSGQLADVANIPSVASTGTPAVSTEASANVGQKVTIAGSGFTTNATKVMLEAVRSDNGVPYITTINPDSIASDGHSLVFTVSPEARTGVATILSGASGRLLQIVPRVTAIDGGPGRFTAIFGSGFTEGFITVRFGAVSVTDRGPSFDDGIDVRFWDVENGRLDVTAPTNANLPYVVITEGGSSGRLTDLTRLVAAATNGTPAVATEASANVLQKVTLEGAGFSTNQTRITLEAVRSDNGVSYITAINPDSITSDGRSLIFTVPPEARTGMAALLNGDGGRLLQIVPVLDSVNTAVPGSAAVLFGTGFIEGATTVRFGAVAVTDGGPSSNDGLDVRFWSFENTRIDVTVPSGGAAPVTVTTAGGTSRPATP